ncbi:MAG TPA: 3-phosphoshikimate 1-carboxyvinyltransferase [Longimicrobiales bacterium]|nr:3-phosphoshikimate 1-carboxyvinyltransferase [Longimicrobiales bacterium]
MTKTTELRVPGDKSISHRGLIMASLSSGRCKITGLLDSADVRSTASVLSAYGVTVPDTRAAEVVIDGRGLRGYSAPSVRLDCGNSGTTTRLMMGVAAAKPFTSVFDGDRSLRSRPMRRVTDPLTAMGARIRELEQPDRLPIELKGGALNSVTVHNDKSSAQVKSAILLAALCGNVKATVIEPIHSRDHTERMLNSLGVEVRTIVDANRGMEITIDPAAQLDTFELQVPGDFSSAAFVLARGLLEGPPIRIADVGVNATRTGFLDVVRRMQGTLQVEDRRTSCNEPIATLIANASKLHATHIEGAEIPHLIDEIPIIAVLAARAEGETIIRGAGELRVKETDRLKAMAENLTAVGVIAIETEDGLIIEGGERPLKGNIKTFGDHRIAMAFGVLGSLDGNEIAIDDVACVDVSFPTFWETLRGLKG